MDFLRGEFSLVMENLHGGICHSSYRKIILFVILCRWRPHFTCGDVPGEFSVKLGFSGEFLRGGVPAGEFLHVGRIVRKNSPWGNFPRKKLSVVGDGRISGKYFSHRGDSTMTRK